MLTHGVAMGAVPTLEELLAFLRRGSQATMSLFISDLGVRALLSGQQVRVPSRRALAVHHPGAIRLRPVAYSSGNSRPSPTVSDERDERAAGRGAGGGQGGRGCRGGRGNGASGGRGGRRPSSGDDPTIERRQNPAVDPPRMKVNRASRRAAERELAAAEGARSPPASGDGPRNGPPRAEPQSRGGSEAPKIRKAAGSSSKRGRGRGAAAKALRQTPVSQPKPSQVR